MALHVSLQHLRSPLPLSPLAYLKGADAEPELDGERRVFHEVDEPLRVGAVVGDEEDAALGVYVGRHARAGQQTIHGGQALA